MKKIRKYAFVFVMLFLVFSFLGQEVKAASVMEITFADNNMYKKVCSQIEEYIQERNDSKRIIKIDEDDLKNIKSLNLRNSEIAKLDGLENFTGLETLDISNNSFSDISSLAGLTNLTKLNIYGTGAKKVGIIGNLTKLKELNISRNNIADDVEGFDGFEDWANLTNLERLDMSHNIIVSTNGIDKLTNLKYLNLFNNTINDFTGIDKLTSLEYLNLGENNEKNKVKIADENLALLSNLTNLKYFNFSENRTPNIINYIGNMTNLEYLALEFNDILNISNLPDATNLKTLILYNNGIKDVSVVAKYTNIEILNIGKNKIEDISFMFDNGSFIYPQLKKLDIVNNKFKAVSQDSLNELCRMSNAHELEVNYESLVSTEGLPHYDGDIAYVTYDDFGARCDGIYDDFIAIRNAHTFANANGYEVRATEGKTYHIFKYYEDPVNVYTNVDWNNARFVIHDENIEDYSGKFKGIFNIKTITKDIKELKNVDWTVGTNTTKLSELADVIAELNEKGYKEYLVYFEDSNKKQYIRFGADANSGATMQDYCTIDRDLNVLNDIQWDFEQLTKVQILPITEEEHYIRNGYFTSNPMEAQSENAHYRGAWKSYYYNRNLYFSNCANMTISNIKHIVPTEELSGSHVGFLYFDFCSNLKIEDCYLHTWKYNLRSTYDLYMKRMINVVLTNIDSDNVSDPKRWGVMGSNYCKYITFDNCRMSRIDAHCGIYNLDVKNSEIGCKGLTMTGQGTLNLINTKVSASTFMSFRGDYGSTWNGDVNVIDCTYDFDTASSPILFRYSMAYESDGTPHDFGYSIRFPNIYVENLTMDFSKNKSSSSMFLILRTDVKSTETDWEEWYMPDKVVFNGLKMIQGSKNCKILKTKYAFNNFDYTWLVPEGTTVAELKASRDENISVKTSEGAIVPDDEIIQNGMRFVLTDKCEFVIETVGEEIEEPTIEYSEVTFEDENLYNAIYEMLGDVIVEKDDSTKTIKIASEMLSAITAMDLSNSNIQNIAGLEKFAALRDIDLSNNNLTNIQAMLKEDNTLVWDNLEILDISGNSEFKPEENEAVIAILNQKAENNELEFVHDTWTEEEENNNDNNNNEEDNNEENNNEENNEQENPEDNNQEEQGGEENNEPQTPTEEDNNDEEEDNNESEEETNDPDILDEIPQEDIIEDVPTGDYVYNYINIAIIWLVFVSVSLLKLKKEN